MTTHTETPIRSITEKSASSEATKYSTPHIQRTRGRAPFTGSFASGGITRQLAIRRSPTRYTSQGITSMSPSTGCESWT
jgi:hypothetical protein